MNLIHQLFLGLIILGIGANGVAGPRMILLPFKNTSGFKHETWNIRQAISQYFADSLKLEPYYSVRTYRDIADYLNAHRVRSVHFDRPQTLAKIGQELNADAIIHGEIIEFELSRLNLGTSIISGYGRYRASIKIQYQIYDVATHTNSEKRFCEESAKQKEIVDFAGRPVERVDYKLLDSLEFASPQFMGTILGEALQKIRKQFIAQISVAFPAPGSQGELTQEYFEGTILVVRQDEVYLNVGHVEKISSGEVFSVYTKGEEIREPITNRVLGYTEEKIGKVKVLYVKDNHLSQATIIEGAGRIKPQDVVRIRKR